MISREKDTDYQSALCYDIILDDIVLSDFDEQLQHLLNIDCALALSVCKSRNLPSCVFVLSLLYIKRLRSLHLSPASLAKIDNLTTKELYLITTLIANKYLIDEGEDDELYNSELSELTGIHLERINYLEKQLLSALNWNLYISNDEYDEFFHLFKKQIIQKLNKNLEQIQNDDPIQYYNLCFKYLPLFIEYLTLTSLVLLGSTISIITAVHISTLTHSKLMNTLNPTKSDCSHTNFNSCDYLNTSFHEQNHFMNSQKFSMERKNETFEEYFVIPNRLIDIPLCSMDFSRSLIPTLG